MKVNKKLIIPAIIAVMSYLLCYQIPKILIDESSLHILALPVDYEIKLFTPAVIIYIYSYFQWFNAILVAIRQETKLGYRFASALIIASFIGGIIFIAYPTATIRPKVTGNSIFDNLTRIIYYFDTVVCACPSFHCLCSTLVIYILYKSKGVSKFSLYINTFISILVYASTVLTKQHLLIDVPSGILLAIISILITRKITFDKFFDKLNKC